VFPPVIVQLASGGIAAAGLPLGTTGLGYVQAVFPGGAVAVGWGGLEVPWPWALSRFEVDSRSAAAAEAEDIGAPGA
jgi:hypothetical protein